MFLVVFEISSHLKSERDAFLPAMLLRSELGADAVHFDVDAGVPETTMQPKIQF